MEQALNGIGKRCFVNCFETAMRAGGNLTHAQIIECDPKVGREPGGLNYRAGYIQQIFDNGWQCAALQKCAESRRIAPEARIKARKLLDKRVGVMPLRTSTGIRTRAESRKPSRESNKNNPGLMKQIVLFLLEILAEILGNVVIDSLKSLQGKQDRK